MIKLIAFDFDGTLADSVDFCLLVFDKVFERYLQDKAPGREEVYQCFGMNEPGVIRHFLGGFEPEAEEYFYQLHRNMHTQMCPDVYPGCRELLEHLQNKGVKLAILTGRSETTCNISMDLLGLKKYFTAFMSGSPEKTDKSAQMRKLMADNDLSCDEFLYIGDAVSDVESSRRAGVRCLAAAWAKTARIEALNKINPGLVFTSVESMQSYLDTLI